MPLTVEPLAHLPWLWALTPLVYYVAGFLHSTKMGLLRQVVL
jgi:hypothetical protein